MLVRSMFGDMMSASLRSLRSSAGVGAGGSSLVSCTVTMSLLVSSCLKQIVPGGELIWANGS